MPKRVVVGLGNPGKEYEMTRHNLGFLVVEKLAEKLEASWKYQAKFESRIAETKSTDLLLPQTYMNESGRAVGAWLSFYKLQVSQLIVVVDDMDLPFGHMRIRREGTSGGHNGLKSIQQVLGTTEYLRVKMGIGRGDHAVDHVLSRFTKEEKKILPEFIQQGADCVERLLEEDFEKVANDVNRKKITSATAHEIKENKE
jgi:peptidyl-tRNA hydrolase, PTH1 family